MQSAREVFMFLDTPLEHLQDISQKILRVEIASWPSVPSDLMQFHHTRSYPDAPGFRRTGDSQVIKLISRASDIGGHRNWLCKKAAFSDHIKHVSFQITSSSPVERIAAEIG